MGGDRAPGCTCAIPWKGSLTYVCNKLYVRLSHGACVVCGPKKREPERAAGPRSDRGTKGSGGRREGNVGMKEGVGRGTVCICS